MKIQKIDYKELSKVIVKNEGMEFAYPASYLKQVHEGRVASAPALGAIERNIKKANCKTVDFRAMSKAVLRECGDMHPAFYLKQVYIGNYKSATLLELMNKIVKESA